MGRLNSPVGGDPTRVTVRLGGVRHLPRSPDSAGNVASLPAPLLGALRGACPTSAVGVLAPAAPLFSFSLFLKELSIPTANSISLLAISETRKNRLDEEEKQKMNKMIKTTYPQRPPRDQSPCTTT